MPSKTSSRSGAQVAVFIGDIVGHPGREALTEFLPRIRDEFNPSLVIANAENAAGGTGLTPSVADELRASGLDVLTSGNHVWAKKEILPAFDDRPWLLRPANYPPGAPGSGSYIAQKDNIAIGVLNLCGRVFMNPLDCPFQVAEKAVSELRRRTPLIIVDMHAEATSEKMALAWFLDGRVSAVIGTHTHVQTSDARLLPRGTAYITDAGMTGPSESIIGQKTEIILSRFLTQMPQKFEVARQFPVLEGAAVTIDAFTGKALDIKTFRYGGPPKTPGPS